MAQLGSLPRVNATSATNASPKKHIMKGLTAPSTVPVCSSAEAEQPVAAESGLKQAAANIECLSWILVLYTPAGVLDITHLTARG